MEAGPASPERKPSRFRTPGWRVGIAVFVGLLLTIPLMMVYALVYDRSTQAATARESIAAGWGGEQTLTGPLLVVPYRRVAIVMVPENGRDVRRETIENRVVTLAPISTTLTTVLRPQVRQRSIYTAVLYDADVAVTARFDAAALRSAVPEPLNLAGAYLVFGVSEPRGLAGAQPAVTVNGARVAAEPGAGGGVPSDAGFSVRAPLAGTGALAVSATYALRGSGTLGVNPAGRDTVWNARSTWSSPSFIGGFLPERRRVSEAGFEASWRIGNLALNQPLVRDGGFTFAGGPPGGNAYGRSMPEAAPGAPAANAVGVALINPLDLYDRVERAAKYGFLFVGFTFLTLLMFDLIGGARVPWVAYLLVGVGLVLFFVLLLAFAEVIGFAPAYLLASAAIIGLITAYSAAILGGWRRAAFVGGVLALLYGVLYVLLGLEEYALLIGSLLLFVALAVTMYLSRRIDWDGAAALEPSRGVADHVG